MKLVRNIIIIIALMFSLCLNGQTKKEIDIMYSNAHTYMDNGLYEKAREAYAYVKKYDPDRVADCENYINIINAILIGDFTLSTSSVTIPNYGGEQKVRVFGAKKYAATSSAEWCEVSLSGNIIIIRCLSENTDLTSRTAQIAVKYGSKQKILTVVQEKGEEKFRTSTQSLAFAPEAYEEKIHITSNVSWSTDVTQDWISLDRIGNSSIIIKVTNNSLPEERTGKVVLISQFGTRKEITIYQSAGREHLLLSKNNISFGADGGYEYLKVTSDKGNWEIDGHPWWCQVKKISADSIRIKCYENPVNNEERAGNIIISASRKTYAIDIYQESGPQIGRTSKILGGKDFSFGIMTGGVVPLIAATSSGDFTGSAVNYSLGDNNENSSYASSVGYNLGVYVDMRINKNLYVTPGVNFITYKYENSFEFDFNRDVPSTQPHYYIKGYTQNTYKEKYSMKILEMPVMFSYRFPINDISHFQLDMGPVISYGITAKMNINGTSDSETMTAYWIKDNNKTDIVYTGIIANDMHYTGVGEFDLFGRDVDYKQIHTVSNGSAQTFSYATTVKDAPLKRLNFLLSAGFLYEIRGFGVGVYYNYMLSNMANQKYWESDRWPIFQQTANIQMTNYVQKNNYFSLKVTYSFRSDKKEKL